jgi:hypothetical protein
MFEPNTSANKNRKLNKISKILEFINWITQLNSVEMGQLKIKDGKKKQNMMYHSTDGKQSCDQHYSRDSDQQYFLLLLLVYFSSCRSISLLCNFLKVFIILVDLTMHEMY